LQVAAVAVLEVAALQVVVALEVIELRLELRAEVLRRNPHLL
jgi:hypothetical protein